MKLSTVHKQRLSKIARVASAGALVVGSVATSLPLQSVDAAAFESIKTVVGDSRPTQTNVTYTITFKPAASSTTPIAQADIRFCTANTGWSTCSAPGGFDLNADLSTATATGFTGSGTVTRTSANEAQVSIDTPTGSEANGDHVITFPSLVTNPGAGTYFVFVRTYSDAGSTQIDQGTSAFAILNDVDVTGRVAETLTFAVNGVNTASSCGGSENASVTSTATAIPFGNFTSGTPLVACQTVATGTNAVGGYVTTVRHVLAGASPQGGMCRQTALNCAVEGGQSGVNAANVIVDANLDTTMQSWTPGSTFGVGLNANGGQADTLFTSGTVYRSMFGTTPIEVAESMAPTNQTPTTVKLKADVPATQTAGVYQNSFEYVTTPRF